MKKFSKIFALILTVCIMASLSVPAFAIGPVIDPSVKEAHDNAEAILFTTGDRTSSESSGILGGKYREQGEITADPGSTGVGVLKSYDDFNGLNDNVKWTLKDGVVVVSGHGFTARFGENSPFAYNTSIKTVVIAAGVTAIDRSVFKNIPNLKTIVVMDAATVSFFAKNDLQSLKTVVYGANLNNSTYSGQSTVTNIENFVILTNSFKNNAIPYYTTVIGDKDGFVGMSDTAGYHILTRDKAIAKAKSLLSDQPTAVQEMLPTELRSGAAPAPTTPAPAVTSFSDVKADSPYAPGINWAIANSITNGTGNGKFSPDIPCTVAQILTFLWRAHGSPASTATCPFSGIATTSPYYTALC